MIKNLKDNIIFLLENYFLRVLNIYIYQLLRDTFEIFDNNMFVTTCELHSTILYLYFTDINEILLEASLLGTIQLEDKRILNSLEAIAHFQDQ